MWSASIVRRDQLVLALELLGDELLDLGRVDAEKLGERADIDDVLEELALARVGVARVADRGQRHAEDGDVVAELRLRHRPRRIVEEVAARLDLGDVLVPGLRVHRDHQVDAAAPAEMPGLRDPHLVPGRQALDVRGEDVARGDRHAHAEDRAGEEPVGARRARAVDVGELDDEVVDADVAATALAFIGAVRPAPPACAVVEQELLHVPRAGRAALGAEPAMEADVLVLGHDPPGLERRRNVEVLGQVQAPGALSRRRRSSSGPFAVKVMQSIGQMSTQASHSMQSVSLNTVCTSQFRQRCVSS